MERQYNDNDAGPRNFMRADNVAIDPDSDGSRAADGDRTASELSEYPPSIGCYCGLCPRPPEECEQLINVIIVSDSNDDGDVSSETSFPSSSSSEPHTPDSRVTVSDSNSHNEMSNAENYDGSDEYGEGDDMPASPQTQESSSEQEPESDVSMASQHSQEGPLELQVPRDPAELDHGLGASCEVSYTPPQSPLQMLPRRRVYTSEENSEDEFVQARLHSRTRKRRRPRQWQIPPWEIATGSRGGQRRAYFVAPAVPARRRRRHLKHKLAKRIRLDNTSGGRE